jgi:hypothetical protein
MHKGQFPLKSYFPETKVVCHTNRTINCTKYEIELLYGEVDLSLVK